MGGLEFNNLEFFMFNAVGMHVYYDVVKGEWKGESSSESDVKKNLVMVEEMKRQQHMNNTQQRTRNGDDEDRLKRLFEEPLIDNNATPPKIFIRSRL